jgi:sigma-B regulation protein RsbU (phosphoserine phosphatase)
MKKLLPFIFLFFITLDTFSQHDPHSLIGIFEGNGSDPVVCYKQKHRNFFFITFGLIALVSVITFSRFRVKKKAAKELEQKNRIIEEKNKDIVDSINYAKRIQEALLPEANDFKKAFSDSFVLLKPKDIVSGDFYWISDQGNKIFLAAADCTGHGVPGAFMSMIGNAFLNEIIKEKNIHDTNEILDELRRMIIAALKQDHGNSRDGMDIALVSILTKEGKQTLHFSGANNPVWHFRKGAFTEFKADKQPIGINAVENKPFTVQTLELLPGDSIYLFSDGYADQFGGKDGKKFRYKPLRELLERSQEKSMSEQKQLLISTIESWKGDLEQVDDILVMGIKI